MQDLLIHEWFANSARQYPYRLALQGNGVTATFRELEERSCNIQRALSAIGVQKGDVIALATEDRSFLIAAILGVLKQGGIFAPISPFFPDERLQTMLHLVQPKVVVGESAEIGRLRQLLSGLGGTSLLVDKTTLVTCDEAGKDVYSPGWDGDDCCYIFFTSGSTGQPKPIAGRIKAVDHFVRWEIEECEIAFGRRTSQLISPTFDAFLRDIFVPLCSGGTICLPPMAENGVDPNVLCAWIEEEEVNVIHCVPTLLRALLSAAGKRTLQSVTHLFVSGEVLTPGDVGRWFQCRNGSQARLINLYGPSETTMTKFAYCVNPGDQELGAIPIGKPIRGAEAILLDQHGRPSPDGAIGEIYIRTPYRSLGYYGQPDLNKEAFIANPFRNDPNDLLYRTGDIGRVLEDGNYEFLGRIDSQIKLRGIRIELSEIESVIRTYPQVQDCVVLAPEAPSGEKTLCAYYVSRAPVNAVDLRDFLGQKLPEYMRPAAYVELPKLPLLSNGKVDRSQLPAPQQWLLRVGHLPPAGAVEEILCGIWEEILRLEKVGVEDSFFELGGHSLMATQVISRVRHVFDCEVSLRAFLQQPTIRKLACEVERQTQDPALKMVAPISVVSGRERGLPLSFAQQRLWFLDQLHPNSSAYNIPYAVRMKGDLNVNATREALSEIVKRHEALRTTFMQTQEGPVQLVQRNTEFRLEVEDLCGVALEEREAEMLRRVQGEADRPFDLEHGPVLRARILRLGREEHVLQVVMHHIVNDGWSQHILLREFACLYAAFAVGRPSPLAEMELQYGDFAVWQRKWLRGEVLAEQVDYWKRELRGMDMLELPVDSCRTDLGQSVGVVPFRLTTESTQKIKQLSNGHHATVFMVLTAAFHLLLGWYAGQEDVVAGTDVANRNRREVEGMIGFFVNQLVLRTDLSGDPAFSELLQRVRTATLGAYAHQDVPFEKVVEELAPARIGDGLPLFNVKMIMQNTPEALEFSLPGLQIETIPVAPSVPKYLLAFTLAERAEALQGELEYPREMFKESSIELFLLLFREILDLAVANPGIRLNAIREQLHGLKESHQRQKKVSLQYELERRFSSARRVKVVLS
ncbi:MAG TPA: amino acid adenylation domain-containing protein [Candidatus Angelobacter sp.]|nr:amino acid adenylation domain-containing protein [Candidatus Angelobacter sp.]